MAGPLSPPSFRLASEIAGTRVVGKGGEDTEGGGLSRARAQGGSDTAPAIPRRWREKAAGRRKIVPSWKESRQEPRGRIIEDEHPRHKRTSIEIEVTDFTVQVEEEKGQKYAVEGPQDLFTPPPLSLSFLHILNRPMGSSMPAKVPLSPNDKTALGRPRQQQLFRPLSE